VMAFGCVGTGPDGPGARLAFGLAVGFLATVAPSKTEPLSGLSIDAACAVDKPGMGRADVVFMPSV
jgi:hypothetical protein